MPHLSRIRSAHAQIIASGEENLSDRTLAYAMTLALPESYTTKQNLWLRSPSTSAEVVGGVQAERARRKTSHNSGALIAIQQQGSGKSREKGRLYGPDKHAYCTEHKAYGHDTSKCIRLHGRPSQPRCSPADVAITTAPPFVSDANVAQYDSDGSAFIATSFVPADLRFVVDSGACIRAHGYFRFFPYKFVYNTNTTNCIW